MPAERPHALYSPSRLSYLARCPWWTGGVSGNAAQRGTEIGERIAASIIIGNDPEGDEAEWAVNAITSEIMPHHEGFSWRAETWVDTQIPGVSGYVDLEGGDNWGSAAVIEIKTGFGDRPIPPYNPQIEGYALGIFMSDPTINDLDVYLVEVDKRRMYHHKYTRTDVPAIRDSIVRLLSAVQRSTKTDLVPGKHCAFCEMKFRCEALSDRGDEIKIPLAVPTPEAMKAWASVLSTHELAVRMDYVLPKSDLVEILAGALKSRAISIIEAGGDVPGWTVKRTSGNRVWIDEPAAIAALESAGVAIEKHPPSPAAAEKLLKAAGADKDAIVAFAAPGAPRLSLRKL